MSALARGIVWRKGMSLSLFVLGTVVVSGCLVSARFSELTDAPAGSIGVLLLLGVVALSLQAAAAARARRPEIALAQIRGRHGTRLFAYYLAEPVTILVLGTATGVVVGRFIVIQAAHRWLDTDRGDPGRIGSLGWATVALAFGVSVAAVLAGSWRTVREPLIEQLDSAHRPRPAATVVLFGQTLVIVAAAIAAYQASQNPSSRQGAAAIINPALLSPVLLGLAAGQVASWALRGIAAVSTRRTQSTGGIGPFLAVRRMARRSDTVFGLRLVIAAAVVTAVTATATTAVSAWQDETTRLALGGPTQFPVDGGALAAYEASHQADPDGRWLMAMTAAPDQSEPYRRVFADTSRWSSVVGGFLDHTGAGSVARQIDRLDVGEAVQPAKGSDVSVTFDNASLQHVRRPKVTVLYAGPDGSVQQVAVEPVRPASARGVTTATQSLRGCSEGCAVTQLAVEGARQGPGTAPFLEITAIDFAGQPLLERSTWRVQPGDRRGAVAVQRKGLLRVRVDPSGDATDLEPAEASQRLAILSTSGLHPAREGSSLIAYAVDGSAHKADIVGTVNALPLIGRRGMLLDLPRALAGGGSTIATATSVVVARADTPATVLDALQATGLVGRPRAFASSLDAAHRRDDVQAVRLYTLMSIFCALVALVGLAASLSGQRLERQQEAASLRVTGVRVRHIRAANHQEARWLALSAVLVVAVTGWVAARLTLEGLSLVPQTAYTPTLHDEPSLRTLAVVAIGAGVLVWLLTLAASRRIVRSSPPSMLRDEVAT